LELEKERRFPKSIFEKACQLGFVGIEYPEEYGGQSFGLFENILVAEEFCRKDSGVGISINLADIASGILLRHGVDNQRKEFLLPVTQGKAISAVAISSLLNGVGQGPVVEENSDECVLSGGNPFVIICY
jgi:acyl-CoA dehydrogenase